MAIKISLSGPSKVTTRTPDVNDGVLGMSRLTYQMLGSLVQNKNLTALYDSGALPKEYMRTLDDLNDLYLKNNYPATYSNLVIKSGIVELNEYLGSLGLSETYPYSKDIVNIPAWVGIEAKPVYRYIIDTSDDTILMDGDQVLVVYT